MLKGMAHVINTVFSKLMDVGKFLLVEGNTVDIAIKENS
jgi:hypothetical protein